MQRVLFPSILSLGALMTVSKAHAETLVDDFRTPFNAGTVTANSVDPLFGAGWVGNISNPGFGAFNTRAVGVSGVGSQASSANGSLSVSLSPGSTSTAAGWLDMYYFNSSDGGLTMDRSRTLDLGWVPGNPFPKWRIHLASYSGQRTDWTLSLGSASTITGQQVSAFVRVWGVTSAGWLTFDMNDPTPGRMWVNEGFDFSKVYLISLGTGPTGQNQTGASFSIDSFTFVPAPGAAALLGAAGLLGRRRRA